MNVCTSSYHRLIETIVSNFQKQC